MTIGIAAAGPNAGLAVYQALAAVEKVATGAIGGFAVYAAIDAGGELYRARTQRGGTRTLFVDAETTGVAPPPAVAAATIAGVMSSGPDRPEPLDQFLPAQPGVGLVTGHRLPNAASRSGRAVNLQIMDGLRAGQDAQAAVDAVFNADDGVDAGVVVIDRAARIYARNSARVASRPDIGHARREDGAAGAVVEVLHNAIFPVASLAALAADIAMQVMVSYARVDGTVTVRAGVPVIAGDDNRVLVTADGVATQVVTTDARIVQGRHNCAAIYLGATVYCGPRLLGRVVMEPNVMVDDGRIIALSGQTEIRIGYVTHQRS